MRIVLKLKANKDCIQNRENNSKFYTGMHGWIYNKLKNTEFSEVYGQKGFKPFCFSNLFLIKNKEIKENEIYNIIISSPNEMFMIAFLSNINTPEKVNLGEYSFELISYKPLGKKGINESDILESETITNITIRENGKRKAITLNENPDVFKEHLNKNLIRKFNQYNKGNIEDDFKLLENIEIKEIKESKSAIKINLVNNSDNLFTVIGSRYRFEIGNIGETQKKILECCYDLGFGERNSFGFGFMNIKKG